MTPSPNSGARKRTEDAIRPPSVLVEIPVDLAQRYIAWCGTGPGPDVTTQIAVRVKAALDARITTNHPKEHTP